MLPSNKQKFNKPRGKTKFFPFKQFRFDMSRHPVITSTAKRSFKIKSILSVQEEQMLIALSKTYNEKINETIRIALYNLLTQPSNPVQKSIPFAIATSKNRGHTSRSRSISIRLPKEEKVSFKLLAETYKLSEQETLRLAIIHEQKSIRTGIRTEYPNCRMLSQGELWDAWSKDKPVSSGKADKLKAARDYALQEKIYKDKANYKSRGDKIDELIYKGEYLVRNQQGKIDIGWLDRMIEIDEEVNAEFSFDLYLEELQIKDADERELRIQKQLFYAERYGYPITEQDAIEIIDEEDREKLEALNYQEEDDIMSDEEYEQYQKELESHIEDELGKSISDLPIKEVERLKKELENKRIHEANYGWREQSEKKAQRRQEYLDASLEFQTPNIISDYRINNMIQEYFEELSKESKDDQPQDHPSTLDK